MNQRQDCIHLEVPPSSDFRKIQSADEGRKHRKIIPDTPNLSDIYHSITCTHYFITRIRHIPNLRARTCRECKEKATTTTHGSC